jgi:hypothetical protein
MDEVSTHKCISREYTEVEIIEMSLPEIVTRSWTRLTNLTQEKEDDCDDILMGYLMAMPLSRLYGVG